MSFIFSSKKTSLHPIEASHLHARRERVFLVLAGLFLGTLAMLNILGISRFLVFGSYSGGADGVGWQWGKWGDISFAVAVGVLPYPLTFFCTDVISEFYGRKRANFLVFVGLILNVWVVFILWIGGLLPEVPVLDPVSGLPSPDVYDFAFWRIRQLTFGAVTASMIAYMAAQFCDVYLFHFWKRVTKGKHLWLRNNGSTMVSQMVDTVAVILITHFYAHALPINPDQPLWNQLFLFIGTGYAFKFIAALIDTIPFYIAVGVLSKYLQIDPRVEHDE